MVFSSNVGVSDIVSLGSLGYQVYAGEEGRRLQRSGLRDQRAAQDEAQAAAVSSARRAAEAANRARRKAPDLDVLLGNELKPRSGKRDSIDVDRLLLGRPGVLGY